MKILRNLFRSTLRLGGDATTAVSLPSHVAVGLPESAKALEAAWQRRREELGRWQPSNGWLIDPSLQRK